MSHHGRSSASQYFMEQGDYGDEEEDYGGHGGGGGGSGRRGSSSGLGPSSSANRPSTSRMDSTQYEAKDDYQDEQEVAELLTKATVTPSEKTKLENLRRVNEILTKKQPALLDNFLNEMLDFQTDSNADVRKYILEFIENACKTDPETIPKVLHNMMMLLQDKAVSVQKKAIQVSAKLCMYTLMWLSKSKNVGEEMEQAWASINELKRFIGKLIDSDLDGIRTHTVKFIEAMILLQTYSEPDSFKRENDFCLDDVPINLKIARPRKLEEDARILFEDLLKFHGSRHATSVNLMTCMGSIIIIAKLRPSFMGRVVSAMEKLNAILPPTLERSQVTSVRKYMKVQLFGLLKHSRALEYIDNIAPLLTDLGASSNDFYKAIPNWDEIKAERRKRQRADREEVISRKRAKLEEEDKIVVPPQVLEDSDDDDDIRKPEDPSENGHSLTEIEKSVFKQLSPEMAAELVLASMDRLPEAMPAHFTASFTPIAMAGTESQIRHVSRLLAAQITAYQLGPEAALQAGFKAEEYDEPTQIPTLVSGGGLDNKENKMSLFAAAAAIPSGKKKIVKTLKLSEITKPLTAEENQKQLLTAVHRILSSSNKLDAVKTKLVCSIAVNSGFDVRFYILQFIQSDVRNHLDIGLSWIIAEYCLGQEFIVKSVANQSETAADRYEWTFFNLMRSVMDNAVENEKTQLARRLYMEAPTIPDKGLDLLKVLCSQPLHATNGMTLLMDLALKRPRKLYYLSTLLEFCIHSAEEVRIQAVNCVINLYNTMENMRRVVEDQAVGTYLNSLRFPHPPEILFVEILGRPVAQKEWSDDMAKALLSLYLQLLTIKNSLIHDLANIYVESTSEVKRSVLRSIEAPVRKMGMDPPELMKLLDNFPKGAETLITRILHLLTDKTLPSVELVSRVRNLYAKRVSDVRFLIPVLNGLSKSEILAALPKLIKLNPNVVKEVFNRLLGIHSDSKSQHVSPVTPVDLMVALHNMEPSKCDVKTIIKATSLCFNESEVYSAEVLAIVINQLLEQTPLPTLLMRSVIQTIALHPKLTGFVMNTLGRLVNKQIWTQPKVWEGFVKCCQRTIPKSIPVLLTLPPQQLQQALSEAPDLRSPMAAHLMSLSDQQRSCLPPMLLNIVLGGNMAKQEYNPAYDEYHHGVKEEYMPQGSPRNDLSIEVKDEHEQMVE